MEQLEKEFEEHVEKIQAQIEKKLVQDQFADLDGEKITEITGAWGGNGNEGWQHSAVCY